MPIEPPGAAVPPRFDPVYVTEDDLEDLATFTGMSRQACLDRVRSYTSAEMVEAWRRADPRTAEQIAEFYRNNDLYIWDLMQWHASEARLPYWAALTDFVRRFPAQAGWRRVLDFGCGVGTDGLFLASRGYDVTLVDVDGPAFRFARHRVQRRGLPASFVESQRVLPETDGIYDAAVCFDVFEHLPDPIGALRALCGALRQGGVLVQTGTFSGSKSHPYHLADNERRFGGMRWACYLAGMGLHGVCFPMLFRKRPWYQQLGGRIRYAVWRVTGLWVTKP